MVSESMRQSLSYEQYPSSPLARPDPTISFSKTPNSIHVVEYFQLERTHRAIPKRFFDPAEPDSTLGFIGMLLGSDYQPHHLISL